MKNLRIISLALAFGIAVSACAQSGKSDGDSWKEEVLLHDGQKIIVERSQTYGGRHEIGQAVPAKEHTIRFKIPNSNVQLSWASEYGEELGRTNFNLLALHIKQGTAYLVAEPNLCLSYNKWGRPNPPYVFFKFEGKEWKRIALVDVPFEFKTINLIVNNSRVSEIRERSEVTGYVPFTAVQDINDNLRQPQLKTILREPLSKEKIDAMCEELIRYKCGWGAPGEFNRKYFESTCK
ncbi:MAG: hypothetical protein V4451_06495 [Pseudomonadota bacterium]